MISRKRLISLESQNKYICSCILEVSILIHSEKQCSGADTARWFGLCDLGNIKNLLEVNAAEEWTSHSEQGSELVQIFMHTSFFNGPFSVLNNSFPGLDLQWFCFRLNIISAQKSVSKSFYSWKIHAIVNKKILKIALVCCTKSNFSR